MSNTKFEKLVDDVISTTRRGQTRWHVTPTDAFAEQVIHGGFIFRSFSAKYEKDGEGYVLGFIEKKAPHPDADDERVEDYLPELLIFKDDQLILTITQYHVEVESLRRLAAVIGDRNEDAKALLDKF
jgi:hypothetical protein